MPAYPYNHQHPHFPLSVKTEGIPTSLSSLTNGVESHISSSLMPDFNSAITPQAILLKHFGIMNSENQND